MEVVKLLLLLMIIFIPSVMIYNRLWDRGDRLGAVLVSAATGVIVVIVLIGFFT